MIYGLYLSATGVMSNSYRQDVIANNLANVETDGFKRALAVFHERPPEGAVDPSRRSGDPMLDRIGGGRFASPTSFDHGQGGLEPTGNPLDLAVQGRGYFAVAPRRGGNGPLLTRDGGFMIDPAGDLVTADDPAMRVLNPAKQPINLLGYAATDLAVSSDGVISAHGQEVARVGTFDVPDAAALTPIGGAKFQPADPAAVRAVPSLVHGGAVERSNVDATVEMTRLIDAQRQLEANATLLKIQDSTLGKLVNEAARIT